MVIRIGQKHMFELIRNTKNAFDLETFDNKYLPEYFEIYHYLAGDISSGILRLKGFIKKSTEEKTLKEISNYFNESCSLRCPVFIVKRINEEEFEELSKNPREVDTFEEKTITLEKENFDKDSLVLQSTSSLRPTIVIDPKKMNAIPKGSLPADISEIIKEESKRLRDNKNSNSFRNNNRHHNNKQNNNNNNGNSNNNNNNKGNINNNSNNTNNNGNSNNKTNNNQFKNNNKKHFNKGSGK